jgi:hypothetical protein
MSAFSPLDAAFEGIRVVRREPKAVLYWIAVWAVALAIIAAIRLFTGALTAAAAPTDEFGFVRRFGKLAVVLVPTLLALWVMTQATVYRAVLRPGEHGWHLFKLGPDEARIAVLSAAETLFLLMLGGVPAYLLLVLLNPIFEVAPSFNFWIAAAGFVGTIAIDFWLAVRLSLAPAQTFAERNFPFRSYWGFARGRSWRVLLSYVIVACEVLGFLAASVAVGVVFGWLAEAANHWHGPAVLRRAALWMLVPVTAGLLASAFVAPVILICGCQAFVYRAIAAEGRATATAGATNAASPA